MNRVVPELLAQIQGIEAERNSQIVRTALASAPKAEKLDFSEIVAKTVGYNGADIHEICEVAKMSAIEREIKTHKRTTITPENLFRAINTVRSSVLKEDEIAMNRYMSNNKNIA